MLGSTVSSLLVGLLLTAAPALAQHPQEPCKHGVHVIAAPGSSDVYKNEYGLLSGLTTNIIEHIPDSNRVKVPYPAGESNLPKSTQAGHNLRRYVREYTHACPRSRIVLVGYSLGAVATMNTLCGGFGPWPHSKPLKHSNSNNVIAAVVYGDETRQANQPYNRGTCKNGSPHYPRTSTGGCAYFANHIASWCDAADNACCYGGTSVNAHFAYPERYNTDALNFVIEKYNESL